MDGDARWPLGAEQRELLAELATLIARGGAWRFLHAPVVAESLQDYPDAWDGSRAAVARLVGRTLWHAHFSIDAVIDDIRRPAARSTRLLRDTRLELTRVDATATFTLASIGNDDVAGAISHEVGRAFVGWLARDGSPFRTAGEDGVPSAAIGSIATVYLGLGVIAANAAHYARSDGEVRGRNGYHEHHIARAGGLDVRDLAFLLAVQATVRNDVLPALETLRLTQAGYVAAWREVLDDHEDELTQWLGISGVDALAEPLSRPEKPAPVVAQGAFDERDLEKAYYGQPVFRYAQTSLSAGRMVGLFTGGFVGGLVSLVLQGVLSIPDLAILAITAGGATLGTLWGRGAVGLKRYFRCASCGSFVEQTDKACHGCGGHIVGEIADARARLDREEDLEGAQRAATEAGAASRASVRETAPRTEGVEPDRT